MCPSDLQQLWKEVSGVPPPSQEESLPKQAEGLDLSTNSSNSTSAYPKAASTHLPLHSLPNGQSHSHKRDRSAQTYRTTVMVFNLIHVKVHALLIPRFGFKPLFDEIRLLRFCPQVRAVMMCYHRRDNIQNNTFSTFSNCVDFISNAVN